MEGMGHSAVRAAAARDENDAGAAQEAAAELYATYRPKKVVRRTSPRDAGFS